MPKRAQRRFYEHEQVSYDQVSSSPEELEALVSQSDSSVLSFSRNSFRTDRHVGLLQTSSESIEILPKIFESKKEDLGIFLLLLRLTGEVEIRTLGTAELEKREGSLLEAWIHHFASTLNSLLQRQYQREYVEVERSSDFIRGRLLIEEMQAGREKLPGNYPCRHEVYTEDNRLNQTLKYCNHLLLGETRKEETQRLLEMNDVLLKDVTDRPVTLVDHDGIQLNRLNQDYEPVLQLCRLILQSSSLDVRAGRIRQMAFTFNMAKLFERSIAHLISRYRRDIHVDGSPVDEVAPQSNIGNVFGVQGMDVDLELRDEDGNRTLVDTKYKGLQPGKEKCGVEREDFYQMYSYAKGGKHDYDRVVLLYPNRSPVRRRFESQEATLFVRSVDLRSIYDGSTDRLAEEATIDALNGALSDLHLD